MENKISINNYYIYVNETQLSKFRYPGTQNILTIQRILGEMTAKYT